MKTLYCCSCLSLLLLSCSAYAQTEDFEGETVSGTNFSVGTELFIMVGDLLISEYPNFSCDGNPDTNRYMDSGWLDGLSTGTFGWFAPVNPSSTFQVSTSAVQCGWPGINDGVDSTNGTVRFIGLKVDNTSIYEDFNLVSYNFTDLLPFTFSDSIWGGKDLKNMQIDIVNNMDYWAMDNLVLTNISTYIKPAPLTEKQVQLCPNPTAGLFHIKSSSTEDGEIVIRNYMGQAVKKYASSDQIMDISMQPKGIYFVSIGSNAPVITLKIIKQ